MSRRHANRRSLILSALGPSAALLVVGFFGAYALFGANGLLALGDYRQQLAARNAELATLARERAHLSHRVALLDPAHADPDMADELVRKDLGLARPDEAILEVR